MTPEELIKWAYEALWVKLIERDIWDLSDLEYYRIELWKYRSKSKYGMQIKYLSADTKEKERMIELKKKKVSTWSKATVDDIKAIARLDKNVIEWEAILLEEQFNNIAEVISMLDIAINNTRPIIKSASYIPSNE